jgi:hypothetical protein
VNPCLASSPGNEKTERFLRDFNGVTPDSTAIWENLDSNEALENREVESETTIVETRGFQFPSFNGFGFVGCRKCLPSGRSLREAMIGHFETGPLHGFLGKRLSEQRWAG